MPQFAYKARKRSGEIVQGVLDVSDRGVALQQIERLGLFPVIVDAPRGGSSSHAGSGGGSIQKSEGASSSILPQSIRSIMARKRRPKMQELATFTQQLANLLNSGMPLTVALNSMTHLESKGIPRGLLRAISPESVPP